jgi:hypothetical protein
LEESPVELDAGALYRFSGLVLRKPEETMAHYPYLIIGGGMTAAAAIHGIREIDPTGAIVVERLGPGGRGAAPDC